MPNGTIKDLIEELDAGSTQEIASIRYNEDNCQTVTYGELKEAVRALGNGLINMGIRKGDKIGIMAENRNEWPIVYLSVTTIGAIIVPISILWEPPEIETITLSGELKMVFTSGIYLEKIETVKRRNSNLKYVVCFDRGSEIDYSSILSMERSMIKQGIDSYAEVKIDLEEIAEILFVSTQIGVTLSHRALIANMEGLYNTLQIEKGTGKKLLMLIPYSHLYPTQFGILLSLKARWAVVLTATGRMDRILKIIKDIDPSYIVLVPLILERMYNRLQGRIKKKNSTLEQMGLHRLESVFVAGVKCLETLIERVEQLGLTVLEGYGLSEMAPFITMSTLKNHRPGTVGKPLTHVEVKIDSPDGEGKGEILARGPNMMSGYHSHRGSPGEMEDKGGVVIDREGWLHTGDIGKLDSDGFLRITGRLRKIIVSRGGTNIYPREIEARLSRSPLIAKVKVVGKWDEEIGEYPYVYIQLESGLENGKEKEIEKEIEGLAGRMAAYKMPKGYEIVNEETMKRLETAQIKIQ